VLAARGAGMTISARVQAGTAVGAAAVVISQPQSAPSAKLPYLRSACSALLWVVTFLIGPALANDVTGAWLSPSQNNWPLIPIHAVLTPDGRVLTYGTKGDGQQTGYFIYDVWDPDAGLSAGHVTLNNLTRTDLFCSAQVILPQSGDIFLAGGDNWTGTSTTNTGNNNTNVYRYTDRTLNRTRDMNRRRWYASSTVLLDGEIYIQGGSSGQDRPEVRDADGYFRLLSNVDTSSLDYWYPRNFVAPDGRIFGFDASGRMFYVNPAGSGQIVHVGQFDSAYRGRPSAAAMFQPGRILQFGGSSKGAVVIDIRSGSPVLTPTQSLSSKRKWVSATILPDGRVLATGGSSVANELTGVNNAAEIWNPGTGKWTAGAKGARPRLYHSGALLLPDATVLVHGGGAPGPVTNLHAEIYYPPYLYNSSGEVRSRPRLVTVPTTIQIGGSFSVTSDSIDIRRVTLVKTGSVTHSVNMDQRFLELPFTQSSTTSFIQGPSAAADAPPGFYLLFLINDRGVPSVGSIVRINASGSGPPPPPPSGDQTPTVGGTGGSPFNVTCNSSEAMVGIHGRYDSNYVRRLGVRCVPVDADGRWIGDPVNRSSAGGDTGSSFKKTCARDNAVASFRVRSSDAIVAVNFECRALSASGVVTGSGQPLYWVGGSGGTVQGPFQCDSSYPGYALGGRASDRVDAVNLQCRRVP
jgi:hypothetical protein